MPLEYLTVKKAPLERLIYELYSLSEITTEAASDIFDVEPIIFIERYEEWLGDDGV